jgi:hypothetical protein
MRPAIVIFVILAMLGCKQKPPPEPSSTSKGDGKAQMVKEELKPKEDVDWVPLRIDYPEPFIDPYYAEHGVLGGRPTKLAQKPPLVRVPPDVDNVARGKLVSLPDDSVQMGEPDYITDGDKRRKHFVEFDPKDHTNHITIDLGSEYEIYAVAWWHCFERAAVYYDVVVQLGRDQGFEESVTLFNSDHDGSLGLGKGEDLNYVETYKGWLAGSSGAKARYVRLYSHHNSKNLVNQYTEVEVYGRLPR